MTTKEPEYDVESMSVDDSSKQDLELEVGDLPLTKKMHLINNALDEIGFTWFHFKYMLIAGYGYLADSLLGLTQSTVQLQVNLQFNQTYPVTTEIVYVGLLTGAIFFGVTADLIGRKLVFNSSLLLSALVSFLVGASPSIAFYCIFLCLSGFFIGGNLGIDALVFLEILPSNYNFLVTFFACFWSLGQLLAYIVAYIFMVPKKWNSCSTDLAICELSQNRGWRYVWYVDSAIILVFAVIRLLLKLDETPKYLASNNRDEEAIELLNKIATKYNRKFSLSVEQLRACGVVEKNKFDTHKPSVLGFLNAACANIKSLFANKKMCLNMALLLVSWFLLGIAYPLYGIFLPQYLAKQGATTSASTNAGIYGDAMLANGLSFFGPVIAAALILIPKVGHKGALCIGGLLSMVFLMCYTTVRTHAQNQAFTTISYITIYIYYGCLYAYTPEVLPSFCRATGSGLAFVTNRFASIFVPVINFYTSLSGSAPIYVCAACIGALGLIALVLPFDPSKQRSI